MVTETITVKVIPRTRQRLEKEDQTKHRGQQMTRKLMKLFSPKQPTTIGTWNVRTMYQSGKSLQIANEMDRYNIEILGLSEVRWNTAGMTTLSSGHTVIFSGNPNEDDIHDKGVGFMLTKKAKKSLLEWNPISARVISARFDTRFQKTTFIQVYAPTNTADEDDKNDFYNLLQSVVDAVPKRDILIILGDLNAKVGDDRGGREREIGPHGIGQMNENGEMFADFCAINSLVIGGTWFPHKSCHKTTWISPSGDTENQIDHITISRRWRSSLQDVRTKRGADAASDHHLVIGKIKLKLLTTKKRETTKRKFNVEKFKDQKVKENFQITLRNRFSTLLDLDNEEMNNDIDDIWNSTKTAILEACEETVGFIQVKRKKWMSDQTWDTISERREIKEKLMSAKTRQQKKNLQDLYSAKDREVKKSCKRDKRNHAEKLAVEAENACLKGDIKTLYNITRQLSGKISQNENLPVKDKNNNTLTKLEDQLDRWKEHFSEVLNRPPPTNPPILEEGPTLNIETDKITENEVRKALKHLKNGKAAGIDGIPPEALKSMNDTTIQYLLGLLNQIWEKEKIPKDWQKGLLVKLPKKGDKSNCNNWRGITLLSIPSKILCSIILQRMKEEIDSKLRDEQAGFRQERSCVDQIATLRIIIEQTIEWQSSLYLNFIDFQKAFDSIDHQVLWNILGHYGIPPKIISMIKLLYEEFSCQVIHAGTLTDPFPVTTGVRQGCILSPLLFLIVIDWIATTAYNDPHGIQWTLTSRLEDLEFADDICTLSHRLQDSQHQVNHLEETAKRTGLYINTAKTKAMRIQQNQMDPILVNNQQIENVDKFTYLGSVMSTTGGTDEDVQARKMKALQAFSILKPVWKSRTLRTATKIRIFNSNVKSVLLYGCETWRETENTMKSIQVFVNKCLRNILNIRWPEKITNKKLWQRTKQQPIENTIRTRKWKWIGHTLRKNNKNTTKQALDWNPQGQRKRGRPKNTWRRGLNSELKRVGLTWKNCNTIAQNRSEWRETVVALCPPMDEVE